MTEMHEYRPIVGDWYKNSLGQIFEIVAVDEEEDTIAIQFYEGEIEEYDDETWQMLEIKPVEPPEDWSAPFGDMEKDDLGYSDAALRPEDWSVPLDNLEKIDS